MISKKLKKIGVALSAMLVMSMGLTGCGAGEKNASGASGSDSAQKKIAVIRNVSASDNTTLFFNGCIEEGESLGYKVDTFLSGSDDVKMQDMMEQAINSNYDIMVVSHANEGYQYDIVKKAVDKGIVVVGFDCGGDKVEGVTYTSQSDTDLAKISLDSLIENAKKNGYQEPISIIEVNTLGIIVPFDTRHEVIKQYEEEGKIKVAALVSPFSDYYQETYTGVAAALSNNGDIAGVWTASTSFMDGIEDAVNDAGRTDMALTGVDISDTEIERMVKNEQYCCIGAVDPYVIGCVDVRIAVLKSIGGEVPEVVQFPATGVYRDSVKEGDTTLTLSKTVEGFGSSDLYDTDEIKKLREENK